MLSVVWNVHVNAESTIKLGNTESLPRSTNAKAGGDKLLHIPSISEHKQKHKKTSRAAHRIQQLQALQTVLIKHI